MDSRLLVLLSGQTTLQTYEIDKQNEQPHTGTAKWSDILKTDEIDKQNGQPHTGGTAKWLDILKTDEIDKQNVLYHLSHNVTDRHLKPFAQDAVKVSLATQAKSSSVARAIHTAGKEMCGLKASLCEQNCHVIQFSIQSHFI
jgi:hypothetical protein